MSLAQLCFSFKGRINRRVYWTYQVSLGVLPFTPIVVLILIPVPKSDALAITAAAIHYALILLSIYPALAVTTKRFHDTNRSGWRVLIGLIPGGIIYLIVVCGFFKGTDGDNDYGPPTPAK